MASSASTAFLQPLVWGNSLSSRAGALSRKPSATFSACPSGAVAAAARIRKKEFGSLKAWQVSKTRAGPQFEGFARAVKTRDNLSYRKRARGQRSVTTAAFDGYEQGADRDILGETIAEDFYSVLGVVS